MRVDNIRNTCLYFKAAKSKSAMSQRPVSPMKDGLSTAGAWFGFGVALDLISRKLQFSKSPIKNSLAINGIIGGSAGIVTGLMSNKHRKMDSYV